MQCSLTVRLNSTSLTDSHYDSQTVDHSTSLTVLHYDSQTVDHSASWTVQRLDCPIDVQSKSWTVLQMDGLSVENLASCTFGQLNIQTFGQFN